MSRLPPGPRSPALVQLAHWVFRPIPFMRACLARYGETFSVRFPYHPPLVFTAEPEAIRDVFRGDPDALHSGRANRILKPLVGRHSLLLLDGSRHRRQRKLMTPPFHGERMRAYGEAITRIADEAIDRWPRGRAFPVLPEMQGVTLEVILSAVLGLEQGEKRDRFRDAIRRLMDSGGGAGLEIFFVGRDGEPVLADLQRRLGRLSPLGHYEHLKRRMDALIYDELAERRRSTVGDREDVLSLLMSAVDEEGTSMSDEELRDQLVTLFVAGYETTASALAWTMWRLAVHPEVRERVTRDTDYLTATIKETLRLNPIVPIVVRWLTRPQTLGPLALPAEVIVAPMIWRAQRHPALWDDPERFDPQRFLDETPRPHRYFPFGGGTRTCLGMALAYYEMKIVLSRIVERVRYRLKPGYVARTRRRAVTFTPSKGMPVIVE